MSTTSGGEPGDAPDWRQAAHRRAERERERLGRLPDLTRVTLTMREWDARARAAGLEHTFDTDGHVSGPSDDETYDMVEKVMRDEGRPEEATRFAAMRPAVRRGPPPTWNGERPDPMRRGDLARTFGLHMRQLDGVVGAVTLTAGRASLHHHGGSITASGVWGEVANQVFEALLAATDRVFGAIAPLEVLGFEERWSLGSGGSCARCQDRMERWALVLSAHARGVVRHTLHTTARLCLVCAHREVPLALAAAVRGNGSVDLDQLSVVRTLERGTKPIRCTACQGLIARGAWRLTGVLAPGALHPACALGAEPEGFRRALEEPTDFEEAMAWKAKLDASS